jgi:galactonate dehydratase
MIKKIEDLHCDAGWRTFSFLKVTTNDGLTGWAEYNENYSNWGLTHVIHALSPLLVGRDARAIEAITSTLQAAIRCAPGGLNHQAVGAIENSLLDLKAKALGIPVYEMLGGPVRDSLPIYWSHCGSYRVSHAEVLGVEPIRRAEDLIPLGAEAASLGLPAVKCNILMFDGPVSRVFLPGFLQSPGYPELNFNRAVAESLLEQVNALKAGAGPGVEIFLDANFNFRTEGFLQLGRMLEPANISWLELDTPDAAGLALIRRSLSMPIASCESLLGRRQYLPFLEERAVDVAIVDVVWNGLLESLKIAALADVFEINVAPHNFYGHLASAMSAHFCALIPNFRIMELDIDGVPWRDELASPPPTLENGCLLLPTGPGWGCEVDEEAIAQHPASSPTYY